MNQHHYIVNMADLETMTILRLLYLAESPEEAINMAKADVVLQFHIHEDESKSYVWVAQEIAVNITSSPV